MRRADGSKCRVPSVWFSTASRVRSHRGITARKALRGRWLAFTVAFKSPVAGSSVTRASLALAGASGHSNRSEASMGPPAVRSTRASRFTRDWPGRAAVWPGSSVRTVAPWISSRASGRACPAAARAAEIDDRREATSWNACTRRTWAEDDSTCGAEGGFGTTFPRAFARATLSGTRTSVPAIWSGFPGPILAPAGAGPESPAGSARGTGRGSASTTSTDGRSTSTARTVRPASSRVATGARDPGRRSSSARGATVPAVSSQRTATCSARTVRRSGCDQVGPSTATSPGAHETPSAATVPNGPFSTTDGVMRADAFSMAPAPNRTSNSRRRAVPSPSSSDRSASSLRRAWTDSSFTGARSSRPRSTRNVRGPTWSASATWATARSGSLEGRKPGSATGSAAAPSGRCSRERRRSTAASGPARGAFGSPRRAETRSTVTRSIRRCPNRKPKGSTSTRIPSIAASQSSPSRQETRWIITVVEPCNATPVTSTVPGSRAARRAISRRARPSATRGSTSKVAAEPMPISSRTPTMTNRARRDRGRVMRPELGEARGVTSSCWSRRWWPTPRQSGR